MAAKINPIPEGYHTVTPVLTVQGAAKLIDFLKRVFDAKETYRLDDPKLGQHSMFMPGSQNSGPMTGGLM